MLKHLIASTFSCGLILASCTGTKTETSQLPTFLNTGNPLFRSAFTADPATLVVGDTLYVFTGHDECYEDSIGYEGKYGFNITNWMLFSTTDMQTWTEHGVIMRPTDFSYGIGEAWASQCIEKDGKYYFFTSLQAGEPYNSKVVGVAVSDSPKGPFVDAIGKPLITDDMTDNGARGWWNDFDPTPLIASDGTPWLCWGNGTCFLVKLNQDMISLAEEIRIVDLPNYVEGPWLLEKDGWFYIIYVSMGTDRETISYAMSRSMEGPWEPMGEITGMPENSFTIHPAVCQFKGKWYFFYHNGALELNGYKGSGGRRSVCVEPLSFDADGKIMPVSQTLRGVSTANISKPISQ